MTQDQMQQLAEREFPDNVLGSEDIRINYVELQEIRRDAYIKGLQYDRWIPVSERLPTKEDADVFGNIMIHFKSGGIISEYWACVQDWACVQEDDQELITHWQPLPPKPKSK